MVEVLLDAANQGLDLEPGLGGGAFLDRADLGLEERLDLAEVLDPRPAEPLDQDAQAAVRQLQHPHDAGGGAEARQVAFGRILLPRVLLGQQHEDPVVGQRLIDGADALLAAHRQGQDDERVGDDVLERQHRQDVRQLDDLFLGLQGGLGHGGLTFAAAAAG